MRKSLLTLAATSLVASTTVAQANEVVDTRLGSEVVMAEGLEGGGGTILPILLGVAAIILIIVVSDDDDEDEAPFSP